MFCTIDWFFIFPDFQCMKSDLWAFTVLTNKVSHGSILQNLNLFRCEGSGLIFMREEEPVATLKVLVLAS